MFLDFFYLLREAGLPVSTWEWLTFMEALAKGLAAADLMRVYALARATLVKDEKHYDTFDQCFAFYFAGTRPDAGLRKAIEQWLDNPLPRPELTPEQLEALQRFGSLDELRELFEQRLKEQQERHDGGNKWVGTGGTSPFGHGGVHPEGIRVGGSGGGQSAVQVAAQRRFREYRKDITLDIRQLSLALRRLRRLGREGRRTEVNIDGTIQKTAKNAGDLEIDFMAPRENRLKVCLLMDVGGSMDPFAELASRLFSAAHGATHFHEFHAFYFHNCIYEKVYRDAAMRDGLSTKELMRWLPKDTRMIYLGDAHMAPYELSAPYGAISYWHDNPETGLTWLGRLRDHFSHHAWLNPIPKNWWRHPTIRDIGDVFPMYELTLEGLEEAIAALQ
ncbi:MAG: VWA domain-containing protein [Myxococcales bacterium]|nr:VWA domain-containing protein [Myxococcales bacterium]MCB9521961.1 VWA domain-containing protein [Myxococcales bacterium]